MTKRLIGWGVLIPPRRDEWHKLPSGDGIAMPKQVTHSAGHTLIVRRRIQSVHKILHSAVTY